MSDKPDLSLEADDLSGDPMVQFRRWFEDAEAEGIHLANAIALATADAGGRPAVRHVLLRGFDERGFVFYTNLESRKGQELAANPRAAFTVHWQELYRQVRATGMVSPVSPEEADAYFASRPRGAQLAAVASPQSRVLRSREELLEAYRRLEAELAGRDVPRPPNWGGFRLIPDEMELWQGRENRLHDRLRYTRLPQATSPSGWLIERLAP